MRVLLRLKFWRTLRYRLFVAGVALAYLLVALEIPLPAAVHKNTSQPFPCQDHPCGCQTAEQCWTSCCCFTPEERWVWARTHNVQPPAYAEKPAAKPVEKPAEQSAAHGWNTVKLRDRDCGVTAPPTKSCCRKQGGRAACCQTASKPAARQSASPRGGGFRWVSVVKAWRCQGFQTLWVGIGAVLPVPPSATWSPDFPPPFLFFLWDTHASVVSMTPPAPPPRRSLI
ncbi:MAG TPA: hypothetical protein VMG10_05275 [Gemmataceae bacterium]|nr:hypothetical protein [Gemmataceae bacterium]